MAQTSRCPDSGLVTEKEFRSHPAVLIVKLLEIDRTKLHDSLIATVEVKEVFRGQSFPDTMRVVMLQPYKRPQKAVFRLIGGDWLVYLSRWDSLRAVGYHQSCERIRPVKNADLNVMRYVERDQGPVKEELQKLRWWALRPFRIDKNTALKEFEIPAHLVPEEDLLDCDCFRMRMEWLGDFPVSTQEHSDSLLRIQMLRDANYSFDACMRTWPEQKIDWPILRARLRKTCRKGYSLYTKVMNHAFGKPEM